MNNLKDNQALIKQKEFALKFYTQIHFIFNIIDRKFLKLKRKGEFCTTDNSFQNQYYQEIFFLGFWKKLVYLMDYKDSLAITYSMNDFINYKIVYLMASNLLNKLNVSNIKESLQLVDFQWLPFKEINNEEELKLATDTIEYVNNYLLNQAISSGFKGKLSQIPQFPYYFPMNRTFWNDFYIEGNSNNFYSQLYSSIEFIRKGIRSKNVNHNVLKTTLRLIDIFSCMNISLWMFRNSKVKELFRKFTSKNLNNYISLIRIMNNILISEKINSIPFIFYEQIKSSILSSFSIRKLERIFAIENGSYWIANNQSPYFSLILDNFKAIHEKNSKKMMDSMKEISNKKEGEKFSVINQYINNSRGIFFIDIEGKNIAFPLNSIIKTICEEGMKQMLFIVYYYLERFELINLGT